MLTFPRPSRGPFEEYKGKIQILKRALSRAPLELFEDLCRYASKSYVVTMNRHGYCDRRWRKRRTRQAMSQLFKLLAAAGLVCRVGNLLHLNMQGVKPENQKVIRDRVQEARPPARFSWLSTVKRRLTQEKPLENKASSDPWAVVKALSAPDNRDLQRKIYSEIGSSCPPHPLAGKGWA